MKPIRLELENFTVYRGRYQIDFGPLNFFVVKGRTGAGKSSLIDAICYALYGRVPRYGGRKAHEWLISKGQRRMRVALDFSVRGKSYRIEREYTEGTKRSEFRFYEEGIRRAFREGELGDFLIGLIRLDYETFTKVILLPQNQFDRFLKPEKKGERREILNSMLGLSETLYALKEEIGKEYSALEALVKQKEDRLRNLEEISPEALEAIEEAIKKLEGGYERLIQERDLLNKRLLDCRSRDELKKELERLEYLFEGLRGREGEMEEKRQRLRIALELQPYKGKVDEYEEIRKEEEEYKAKKEKLEKSLLQYMEERERIEEEFKRLEGEYRRLDEYEEKRFRVEEILSKTSQYLEISKEKEELEKRKKIAEERIEDYRAEKEILKERINKGKSSIEEVQKRIRSYEEEGIEDRIREVGRIRELFKRLEGIGQERDRFLRDMEENKRDLEIKQQELKKKEDKHTSLRKERESLEEEVQRARLVLKEEVDLVRREGDLKNLLEKALRWEQLMEEMERTREEIRKLEEELLSLEGRRAQSLALELRSYLKEGDICPVCGGRVGPLDILVHGEDWRHLIERLERVREELSKYQAKLESHQLGREELEKELRGLRRKDIEALLEKIGERLEEIEKERARLKERERRLEEISGEEDLVLEGLNSIRLNLERLREKIKGLEDYLKRLEEEAKTIEDALPERAYVEEVERAYQDLVKLRESERKYLKGLEGLMEDLSRVEKDLARLEEEKKNLSLNIGEREEKLRILEEDIGQRPTLALRGELSEKVQGLKEKIKGIREDYDKVNRYLQKIGTEEQVLRTSLKNIEELIGRLKEKRGRIAKELYPLFQRFGDIGRIREYLLDQALISTLQEEIGSYEREKTFLSQQRKKVEEGISAFKDLPRTEEVEASLKDLEKKVKDNRERYGNLKERLQQVKRDLKEKEELKEEIGEIKHKLELYKRLKGDFTDNRLPNYISQLMLGRLVERANYYLFKFTSGHFGLELTEEDLEVMDYSTGHHRPVSSLSGGETFLASLSLAFTVADILSKDAPLESIFIDEGFGSLDRETRESLGEFFEYIKASTSRMVGIITHVEDVADKFTQRIEVEKKGDTVKLRVIY
ncbi:MAG: AAA family ATPase [Aquificaceae bacterium]